MLEALGYDTAQFISHAIGFLITVWLLKRYAWGPLLGLMEERRQKIAGEFEQIEAGRQDVAHLEAQYQAKLRDIENERRQKLVEAVDEGKQVAADLKARALEDIKQLHAKAKLDLDREVAKAKVQLRDEMVTMTMSATERILHEQLDDSKQRDLIGRFIDGLEKAE